jgi:hypothetical protein
MLSLPKIYRFSNVFVILNYAESYTLLIYHILDRQSCVVQANANLRAAFDFKLFAKYRKYMYNVHFECKL